MASKFELRHGPIAGPGRARGPRRGARELAGALMPRAGPGPRLRRPTSRPRPSSPSARADRRPWPWPAARVEARVRSPERSFRSPVVSQFEFLLAPAAAQFSFLGIQPKAGQTSDALGNGACPVAK
jgi:hypothetical protein